LLSGDRLHRSLLSSGMTYPDDPLTEDVPRSVELWWRPVG
jgi:hypothetical protein